VLWKTKGGELGQVKPDIVQATRKKKTIADPSIGSQEAMANTHTIARTFRTQGNAELAGSSCCCGKQKVESGTSEKNRIQRKVNPIPIMDGCIHWFIGSCVEEYKANTNEHNCTYHHNPRQCRSLRWRMLVWWKTKGGGWDK